MNTEPLDPFLQECATWHQESTKTSNKLFNASLYVYGGIDLRGGDKEDLWSIDLTSDPKEGELWRRHQLTGVKIGKKLAK